MFFLFFHLVWPTLVILCMYLSTKKSKRLWRNMSKWPLVIMILDLILQAVIANKNFKLCSMCVYIVDIFSSCNRYKKKSIVLFFFRIDIWCRNPPKDNVISHNFKQSIVIGEQQNGFRDQLVPLVRPCQWQVLG